MSARFTAWFDLAFANSDALCRQKAIQASREATFAILMKVWQSGDPPPEPSNSGQSKSQPWETTWLEYRPVTQDICLIMEIEEDDPPAGDGEGTCNEKGTHLGSAQSMDHDSSQSTDPLPPTGSAQFPILYQDVWLKDMRVELSKSSPAP